jgi:ribonucleoside-diphosphate reductase alpha chain
MHTEHDHFYIRTVRGDNKDPLTQFLKDSGVPNEPDVMKPNDTTVFSFPKKAAEGALTRNDLTAIEHLEIWLAYQRAWCEHKPSITVSVKDHEWMGVGAWVYEHFDEVSGISFLPFSEHTYKQAPYQTISEAEYKEWLEKMPDDIQWDLLPTYEEGDNTTGSQELACSAGACEVVDIG